MGELRSLGLDEQGRPIADHCDQTYIDLLMKCAQDIINEDAEESKNLVKCVQKIEEWDILKREVRRVEAEQKEAEKEYALSLKSKAGHDDEEDEDGEGEGEQDEVFNHRLQQYLEHTVQKAEGVKGPKGVHYACDAIMLYTSQRYPVYSAVSHVMVDTKGRVLGGKLSPEVEVCMLWQVLLDSQIAKLPVLPRGTLVYRGICHCFPDIEAVWRVGDIKVFYEPKSCSLYKRQAVQFATQRGTVFVMKTNTARQIDAFSFYPTEKEAIIRMLVARFTVTRVERRSSEPDHIFMEELEEPCDEGRSISRVSSARSLKQRTLST